jgi:uncharacterized protein DUF4326
MIYIKDRHIYKGSGIYVGREMPYLGLAGSVLGNRCGGRTREERIANFRRDLWGKMKRREKEYWELKRIAELALHEDIILICWCAPKPCHAEVIRDAVEFLNSPKGRIWDRRLSSIDF